MTRATTFWLRGLFTAIVAAALMVGGLTNAAADTSPPAGDPETLTATPLPTWQTNGTVWAIQVVGNVTYVGGNFTKVRPPGAAVGQDEVERLRLAAFDTTTGDLLPWAPKLTSPPTTFAGTPDKNCTPNGDGTHECASVFSIRTTPDQKTLLVSGDFRAVDGKSRGAIAAFDLPTGTLNGVFKPNANNRVNAIAATNDTVYIGGGFTRAGGSDRSRLASFSRTTGALQPWAPTADKTVTTMVMAPDNSRVVVGGKFDKLNGISRHGIGAVMADGSFAPWSGDQMASVAYTTSLTLHNGLVYTTGDAAGSVSEGVQAVDPYTGATVWNDYCRGASHSMAVVRDVVYTGSHSHDCGGMVDGFGEQFQGYSGDGNRYKLRAEIPTGDGRAKLLHWFPHTDDGNGPRAMATNQDILWMGGEFTLLNDKIKQQGLTRYSFKDQGAINLVPNRPATPIVSAVSPERVTITWPATLDRDNRSLEYLVIKNDNVNNPIHRVTNEAKPWLLNWMTFTDTDVSPGQTNRYQIRAIDPDGGQSARSYVGEVTVPAADVTPQNVAANDKASLNYRFEETTGTTVSSTVGGRVANKGTKARLAQPGALGNGLALDGASGGAVVDTLRTYAKRQASVEAMFRTNTTTGGAILSVGTGSSTTSVSGDNRNLLYMTNSGQLAWGVKPDTFSLANGPASSTRTITTPQSFNDNAWHHVVATFEPGTGSRIYVDGQLLIEDPTLNWSRSMNTWFRIGGDRTTGWANKPSSDWWRGSIDEVAAYDYPLSAAQAKLHADLFLSRPAAPLGLAGTATGTTVDLTWNASAGATKYNVLRDGTKVGESTNTSFSDTGLNPSTAYKYSVVAANTNGNGGESKTITVTTPAPTPKVVLAKGATWKYDVAGTETDGWKAPGFDDSTWGAGPAEIGHGEGDEATAITPFMPDGVKRRITTYVRSEFTVDSAAAVKELAMQLKRDDGVIIYLNGQEVFRNNMPDGNVTAETLATTWAADDGQTFFAGTLPVNQLVDGTNVIAVEIHQNARSSLDLSFDMELTSKF